MCSMVCTRYEHGDVSSDFGFTLESHRWDFRCTAHGRGHHAICADMHRLLKGGLQVAYLFETSLHAQIPTADCDGCRLPCRRVLGQRVKSGKIWQIGQDWHFVRSQSVLRV